MQKRDTRTLSSKGTRLTSGEEEMQGVASLNFWELLVSIANGRGTDSGCVFRMESLLTSRDGYQDLEKLHMTITC